MVDAEEINVTVGTVDGGDGGIIGESVTTVTELLASPPDPLQVNVNVLTAVIGFVASLPETNLLPLHAPDAVQLDASLADQLIVAESPTLTDNGFADSVTAGAAAAGGVVGAGAGVGLFVVTVLSDGLQPATMTAANKLTAIRRKTISAETNRNKNHIRISPK